MRSPPARWSRSPHYRSAGHRLFSLRMASSRGRGWRNGFEWDSILVRCLILLSWMTSNSSRVVNSFFISICALSGKGPEHLFWLQRSPRAAWCCVAGNLLPASYRLNLPPLDTPVTRLVEMADKPYPAGWLHWLVMSHDTGSLSKSHYTG